MVIYLATSVPASHIKVLAPHSTRMLLDYARSKYNPVHSSVVLLVYQADVPISFTHVSIFSKNGNEYVVDWYISIRIVDARLFFPLTGGSELVLPL